MVAFLAWGCQGNPIYHQVQVLQCLKFCLEWLQSREFWQIDVSLVWFSRISQNYICFIDFYALSRPFRCFQIPKCFYLAKPSFEAARLSQSTVSTWESTCAAASPEFCPTLPSVCRQRIYFSSFKGFWSHERDSVLHMRQKENQSLHGCWTGLDRQARPQIFRSKKTEY